MKTTITLFILFFKLITIATAAEQAVVRPTTAWGQPDYQRKGVVIEEQYDGTMITREETLPGSRIGNRFKEGVVIRDNGDGSYTGRGETFPGSGVQDAFDHGFMIMGL